MPSTIKISTLMHMTLGAALALFASQYVELKDSALSAYEPIDQHETAFSLTE